MLRRIRLLIAALLVATAAHATDGRFEQGLLWEISRPGVAPSYLFGTMHVADPRVLALPSAVEEAFAAARTVVLEIRPDDAVARRFSESGRLGRTERLSQLVPPATFERLVEHLAEHDVGRDVADRLKPWAALLISTEHPDKGSESLDVTLYRRARAEHKRIEELESADEKIAAFDSLPRDTQVALLQRALDHHLAQGKATEEAIGVYLRGDLAALEALAWRNGGAVRGHPSHYALFEKRVVRDRSVAMARRLQPHLQCGAAFAAVGALHLHGEFGMLKLLQDEGWQIRPVR
ncbi:TraB/GumN family protein [Aromatoleum evansii]|uniref:TraB/GumN family protein n=1 Tax=Aromatoleum evansii TaxID=59406 RepID=UPI00145C97C9|nr:TraB/GumN family protein [Aromatoleum evansii]NMG28641.1 hypothetical protein [Aromatoleum evansii]